MLLSNDLGYIKENKYQEIERLINESSKLLNSWISSQKQYL